LQLSARLSFVSITQSTSIVCSSQNRQIFSRLLFLFSTDMNTIASAVFFDYFFESTWLNPVVFGGNVDSILNDLSMLLVCGVMSPLLSKRHAPKKMPLNADGFTVPLMIGHA
jgi:hypothetical protein